MEIKISKIVGSLNGSSWSQVHAFKPEDEARLTSHGELLAAVSFKAKQEIEVSSFGVEIVKRLQEIYYSNDADSVLKKLSQTIETLAAEWLGQVDLEIVAMSVWSDYLYAAKNSSGQVWLKRGDELVKLLAGEGLTAVSGKLEPGDTVLAATAQFGDLVTEGSLRAALAQETTEAISESLTAQVHGHENNSRAAAVIFKTEAVVVSAPASVPKPVLPKINLLERFKPGLSHLIARFSQVKKPEIFLGKKRLNLKRRSTLVVALILLLVFGLSLFLAGKKRQNENQQQTSQAIIDEVRYKLDEANNLLTLNPLRAKALLAETQASIKDYKAQQKKPSQEILDLETKVAAALEQVQRQYSVEAAQWYDFNLVKDGFKGQAWDLSGSQLLVWDGSSQTAVQLNLETKAADIVVSGDALGKANTIGLSDNRGFIVASDKVSVVDTKKQAVVVQAGADGWQKITRARGFGSNLYLLDSAANGQIWKYLGLDEGLSGKRSYLKADNLDLSEAVDMAIDGSVWVLFSDGSIAKYTQGTKDAFSVIGLDQPLGEAIKIFTGPDVEHVYVIDRANTRVVVFDKSGDYFSQYVWPGIAGVNDLAVSESLGKIFLLTGQKVFTIDLKP